ncbi:MAG: DUF362 domain-containing protein [Planctomycetota bacterium]|jgi:uncharacterized Fe-S center protein
MPENVYFAPLEGSASAAQYKDKIQKIFLKAGFNKLFSSGAIVAVKIHFGEEGNTGHIAPKHAATVIDEIKRRRGKPFLSDTTTLYRGNRTNAVDHIALAEAHGFTLKACGAPVIIADGLRGQSSVAIKIKGKHFKQAHIGTEFAHADAMIALNHATGHIGTGFACAIKNLGMGCSSRGGKRAQHSHMKPSVKKSNCTACGECIKWCPEEAISLAKASKKFAKIIEKNCIGCGQCFTVCRFDSIGFDWGAGGKELMERVAEYALAAMTVLDRKAGFINFLTHVKENCDCMGRDEPKLLPDIGLVAGSDPVAVDTASLDLIEERGGEIFKKIYPDFDPRDQFRHSEKIGLGTSKYKLVKV